ncbi:MAG: hypothetical protein IPH21_14350 [Flavobacteriales bacterium]|nr:hypothetical protein [Flavobacteriales bacterium]
MDNKLMEVDAAGMDRRILPLPGDLHGPPYGGCSGEVSRGRSSGWIRAVTVRIKAEDSQAHEGPNVEVFQMPLGSPSARWGSPAISGTE